MSHNASFLWYLTLIIECLFRIHVDVFAVFAVFCIFCVVMHMVISLMGYVTIQLEEDHSETQRLLAQERSARTLQENLLNSHLRKQQEIENENKRNISKSNEVILTE